MRYALALLLSSLIFNVSQAEEIHSKLLLKTQASWDKVKFKEYPRGEPEIKIVKGTIPPGKRSPIHRHPIIGSYYVLQGELTVYTENNQVLHAKAGEAYSEVVDKWHYGVNNGDIDVEIIFFLVGVKGLKDTEIRTLQKWN